MEKRNGKNYKNKEIEEWKNQVLLFDKLSLSEAQDLYKKAISTSNETLRKCYLDKVILGTLYVVIDYIEISNVQLFCSSLYNINDVISSFNEKWIKAIKNGRLLNVDKLSSIISSSFLSEVFDDVTEENINSFKLFKIGILDFTDLLVKLIKCRNNYDDNCYNKFVIDYYNENFRDIKNITEVEYYFSVKVIEKIYEYLDFDERDNIKLAKIRVMHYLKLALRTGVMESISDSLIDPKNMEDEIINKLFDESFIKVVDSAIKDDRKRSIIHDRLGLDDQDGMLTSEIGKKYNFSGSYATDVINKTLVKLKDNKKINKYIKM